MHSKMRKLGHMDTRTAQDWHVNKNFRELIGLKKVGQFFNQTELEWSAMNVEGIQSCPQGRIKIHIKLHEAHGRGSPLVFKLSITAELC